MEAGQHNASLTSEWQHHRPRKRTEYRYFSFSLCVSLSLPPNVVAISLGVACFPWYCWIMSTLVPMLRATL